MTINNGLKRFLVWFAVLIGFFALANIAGCIQPMGLKPFRAAGFPFTFAVWGFGEKHTDWTMFGLNIFIAFAVSGPLAWCLSLLRHRKT